jgi:hypothetical protein
VIIGKNRRTQGLVILEIDAMTQNHEDSQVVVDDVSTLHGETRSDDQAEKISFEEDRSISQDSSSEETDKGKFDRSILIPLVALAFTYVGKLTQALLWTRL